jgi:predicted ferric reductase
MKNVETGLCIRSSLVQIDIFRALIHHNIRTDESELIFFPTTYTRFEFKSTVHVGNLFSPFDQSFNMKISYHDSTIKVDIDNTHANASLSNPDPFKFSHGLTGTNQPANFFFVKIVLSTALIPLLLALCLRTANTIRNSRRLTVSLHLNETSLLHRSNETPYWATLERRLLYTHVTLPSPIALPQLILLSLYMTTNIVATLSVTPSSNAQTLAELRARTGSLAALNLVLTILFALRNNPLTHLIGASTHTLNLLHRWTARLVVLQACVHVGAFTANAYAVRYHGREGWESVVWVVGQSASYQWGVLGFAAFVVLGGHSVGAVRAAAYDVFVVVHRGVAGIAVLGVYMHLMDHGLPQVPWVYVVLGMLGVEIAARCGRVVCCNADWRRWRWTTMNVEALPDDATRVSIHVPRMWEVTPGSHVHVYIPRLCPWTSHPFSVAWSELNDTTTLTDKTRFDVTSTDSGTTCATLSCIIRARTGMTRALYTTASGTCHSKRFWCAIEGPYRSPYSLDSYGTVVLFAAGVGITHVMPFTRHLLNGHKAGTVAARKVVLVWCIRHVDAIEWIRPWLEELDGMAGYREVVCIRLYVSGAATQTAQMSGLAGVEVKVGRCVPDEVVREEVLGQVGAMGVVVCGPGGFVGSVREAVRRRGEGGCIDFWEESAC